MSTSSAKAIPTWGEVKSLFKSRTFTKSFDITIGGNAANVPHIGYGNVGISNFTPTFAEFNSVEFQLISEVNVLGAFKFIAAPNSNIIDTMYKTSPITGAVKYDFLHYNANYLPTMFSNINTPLLSSAEFYISGDDEFEIHLEAVLGAYINSLLVKCTMFCNIIE